MLCLICSILCYPVKIKMRLVYSVPSTFPFVHKIPSVLPPIIPLEWTKRANIYRVTVSILQHFGWSIRLARCDTIKSIKSADFREISIVYCKPHSTMTAPRLPLDFFLFYIRISVHVVLTSTFVYVLWSSILKYQKGDTT